MKQKEGKVMNKPLRLSKKTAKEIVKKVLGVSGNALVRDIHGYDTYEMKQGELFVRVENDWRERNGLYVLEIFPPFDTAPPLRMYFHPDTLEEDTDAEEKWRAAK